MSAANDAKLRLFFALCPDARVRKAIARIALEVARDVQGRAPREVGLHLTLAFLGDVPASRLAPLTELGRSVAVVATSFPLALGRIGGTSYRVAWLAPAEYSEPLYGLHRALTDALVALGFPQERRMFRPHVTLARDGLRSVRRGAIPAIDWQVDHLALVASTLKRGGSDYREIAAWPLGR